MMRNRHGFECLRCKMRDRFYAEFNCDPKRNVAYFGLISYINHYILMPVSSEEPEKEFSTKAECCLNSKVCYLQMKNEWACKQNVQKRIKEKKKFLEYFKEDRDLFASLEKNPDKGLPFYLQPHVCDFVPIKKSESFTESPSDDTVSSDNLETTKDKCKLTKKSVSKQKVAAKEPKLGTLKRKRWNLEKLKQSESYEDDLFEEKKLKRLRLEESDSVSRCETISTPRWSVQVSPIEQNQSPCYEDCYSPTELQSIRKEAEEYQYRRNKRRKLITNKREDTKSAMKEEPDTYKVLEAVREKLEKMEEKDCDSEEDFYFTDEEES